MKQFLTNTFLVLIGLLFLLPGCNKNENVKPDTSGMFVKFYGGSYDDYGYSVAEAQDGSFYVAGSTYRGNQGGADTNIFVVKADRNGNAIWTRYYNLGDGYDEIARDMIIDKDGNIVIAGYKRTKNKTTDVLIFKLKNGNPVDTSFITYGDTAVDEKGYNIVQSSDGNYIVYGSTDTKAAALDMYLMKTDLTTAIWKRQMGTLDRNDLIGSFDIVDDKRLVWCGTTFRNEEYNMAVTTADDYGNFLWNLTYVPHNGIDEYGRCMVKTPGGYVVAGSKNRAIDPASIKDIYIVKTDINGISGANDKFVVPGTYSSEANSIVALGNGVYGITGYTRTAAGDKNIYVAKVTEEGKVLASAEFGGAGDDEGKHIIYTKDGGFLVIGTIYAVNNSMMAAYKMSSDLKLVK